MNSVHDMGGMDGLGPLEPGAPDEPVFHEPWEGRIFALNRAMRPWKKWNGDAFRYAVERIPAADYLRMGYWEKRIIAIEELAVAHGVCTHAEIETGRVDPQAAKVAATLDADGARAMLVTGVQKKRVDLAPPRFGHGQRVRARNLNPAHHTRLPRYARGRAGVIDGLHGTFPLPDSNAQFLGENPQHLYTVRFTARELWGEAANERDSVYIDLWEGYLENA
jgi:nitrile hydratase